MEAYGVVKSDLIASASPLASGHKDAKGETDEEEIRSFGIH